MARQSKIKTYAYLMTNYYLDSDTGTAYRVIMLTTNEDWFIGLREEHKQEILLTLLN